MASAPEAGREASGGASGAVQTRRTNADTSEALSRAFVIRHLADRKADTVADAVGCFRSFGSVFVLTGSFALSAALLGAGGLTEEGLWPRLGVAFIGAMHLAGGLMIGWGGHVRTVIRRSGVERTEFPPLRRTVRRRFEPSEIAAVEIENRPDSDGDDQFRVVLLLRTGERLTLTRHSTPRREQAEGIAEAVTRRLGIEPPALARGSAPITGLSRVAEPAREAVAG